MPLGLSLEPEQIPSTSQTDIRTNALGDGCTKSSVPTVRVAGNPSETVMIMVADNSMNKVSQLWCCSFPRFSLATNVKVPVLSTSRASPICDELDYTYDAVLPIYRAPRCNAVQTACLRMILHSSHCSPSLTLALLTDLT